MGQKFHQNRSSLHRFRDKHILAFYTEIQDGQKCLGNDFGENLPVDSEHTLRVKNFIKIALARSVSEINVFYAEIQDGCQKWWENLFGKNLQVDSADSLRVKNFVKIALFPR